MKIFRILTLKWNYRCKLFFNDETVRSDTVQDLKDFNSQSSTTQAKKENN